MKCGTEHRRLITFWFQMEVFQPYCVKENQVRSREERTGNVMSEMIDEGMDEGQVKTDIMN